LTALAALAGKGGYKWLARLLPDVFEREERNGWEREKKRFGCLPIDLFLLCRLYEVKKKMLLLLLAGLIYREKKHQ